MNGRWFPWSEGVNGNKSGEFVTAWRHVHDIFTAVGATNATWVWCPNIDPNGEFLNLASQYPGDKYVDWTGLDGYNWGTNPAKPDRWRSFDQLYKSTYDKITDTIAPSKPLMIGEIGSTEYGGSKAAWIQDTLAKIPASYPKIRGLLWFEQFDDGMDWPIETSSSATSAFAAGIKNPAYASNQFGSLGSGPIQPPAELAAPAKRLSRCQGQSNKRPIDLAGLNRRRHRADGWGCPSAPTPPPRRPRSRSPPCWPAPALALATEQARRPRQFAPASAAPASWPSRTAARSACPPRRARTMSAPAAPRS